MFVLGPKSRLNLAGVHPKLVGCVQLAITLTTQDFTVYEGLRSVEQERKNVQMGTSQTMNSQHIVQHDGFGHAVDLVPFINNRPTWDWDGCYKVAMAMDEAATQLSIANHIRWGGAWDKRLSDFGGDEPKYKAEVQAYQIRHLGKDFLDGPHFEWRD